MCGSPLSEPIEDIIGTLEELLATPDAERKIAVLRASRDFYECDWEPEEVEEIEDEFEALYRNAVARAEAAWGPPDFAGAYSAEGFPVWCNGEHATYWRRGGRLAAVWWSHQDKELPVMVEAFVCSPDWAIELG